MTHFASKIASDILTFVGWIVVRRNQLVIGLIAANIAMLLHYQFITYRFLFHSDAAAKNLIAQEIFEAGAFFPYEWHYANRDLFVWFGHLFVLPFLNWFPNGFELHAVAGLISLPFVLGTVWLIAAQLGCTRTQKLLLMVIVSSGISPYFAENLFGQVSYAVPYYFSALLIVSGWQAYICQEWRSRRFLGWSSLLFVVALLGSWANPERAFATYALPLLACLISTGFAEYRIDGRNTGVWERITRVGVVLLSGFLVGVGLYALSTRNAQVSAGVAVLRYASVDEASRNALGMVSGWLHLFGGLPKPGVELFTWRGIYEGLRFVSATGVILGIGLATAHAVACGKQAMRWTGMFGVTGFATTAFFLVFTSLPGPAPPETLSRYFVPSTLVMFCVLGSAWSTWRSNRWSRRATLLSLGAVCFVVFGWVTLLFPAYNEIEGPTKRATDTRSMNLPSLARLLQGEGLQYGYATYWNAGATTVLSSHQVRVRQVYFAAGKPLPMRHLSSDRWYRVRAWDGKSFLLVGKEERPLLNREVLDAHLGPPIKELHHREALVLVYSDNIAKHLPGWDDSFEVPLRIPVTSGSLHLVGRFVRADGAESRLEASVGEAGALLHGPYVSISPGRYVASFEVDAKSALVPSAPVGRVEVTCPASRKVVASESLMPQARGARQVEFSVAERCASAEFRVVTLGSAEVRVFSVTIERRGTAALAVGRL